MIEFLFSNLISAPFLILDSPRPQSTNSTTKVLNKISIIQKMETRTIDPAVNSLMNQMQDLINYATEQLNNIQKNHYSFDGASKSLDNIPVGVPISQVTFARQLFLHRASTIQNADYSDAALGFWIKHDGIVPPRERRNEGENVSGRGRGGRRGGRVGRGGGRVGGEEEPRRRGRSPSRRARSRSRRRTCTPCSRHRRRCSH
eukprot:TCONS_00027746-protein